MFFCSWDIIFIQRILVPSWALQKFKNKIPIIFDFDDAIYLNTKKSNAAKQTVKMITTSNEIIVSTSVLNDFCSKYGIRATIIPTPVDTDRIIPSSKVHHSIPVIGWIGSKWTTSYLRIIESVLNKLSLEISFKLLTIGADSSFRLLNVDHISKPWSYENENSLLSEIDIGIMPLSDDEFSRAKGGYKIYLYMAGGIPVVASSVGINQEIIRNGENGFLALNEIEWYNSLKKLLVDQNLRDKIGTIGRNDAIRYYDRKICFEKLFNVLEKSIKKHNFSHSI